MLYINDFINTNNIATHKINPPSQNIENVELICLIDKIHNIIDECEYQSYIKSVVEKAEKYIIIQSLDFNKKVQNRVYRKFVIDIEKCDTWLLADIINTKCKL